MIKCYGRSRVPRRSGSACGIAADSLAPRRIGEHVFPPIVKEHVGSVVLVTDEDIRRGQELLWAAARVVAEPGGAAAFAALACGRRRPRPGERLGVLVSGGNTTAVRFERSNTLSSPCSRRQARRHAVRPQ